MQIALCHENVLPHRGGAEMYVADLTRRLAAAGHAVHLYACQWDAAALPSNVHYHRLTTPRGPRSQRPWQFSAALTEALQHDRPQVSVGFDKTLGPDVYYPLGGLHVASAAHNLLKHRPGLQRIAARIAQRFDAAQRSYSRLEREQVTGTRRPLLVVNSDFVRRHAQEYYGLAPESIRVVHNAIDPDRFNERDRLKIRDEVRTTWSLPRDAVVAAIVAMNYRLKGLEPLLQSLQLLPADAPFKLLVAGSQKTGSFERLAKRLGVAHRVKFVGHCPDVRRVFFAADLLVHPTFYDPCSLVVLEALACGLPVITTRNNGAGELMHPPAEGHVIDDPHDSAMLAAKLMDLLDPNRRASCSQAARMTAGRWTFDHHVRAFEGILADVAEQRNRAAN